MRPSRLKSNKISFSARTKKKVQAGKDYNPTRPYMSNISGRGSLKPSQSIGEMFDEERRPLT